MEHDQNVLRGIRLWHVEWKTVNVSSVEHGYSVSSVKHGESVFHGILSKLLAWNTVIVC